jgi:hypothetical protein
VRRLDRQVVELLLVDDDYSRFPDRVALHLVLALDDLLGLRVDELALSGGCRFPG